MKNKLFLTFHISIRNSSWDQTLSFHSVKYNVIPKSCFTPRGFRVTSRGDMLSSDPLGLLLGAWHLHCGV